MDAIEAIKKRRSIRSYENREVPKEVLVDLIDCARLAPTGRGEQPWEFILVREKENLIKLAEIVGKNGPFLKEAGACILVFCKPTKYYLEDGSAATQNILIAATAYGLGSCWIAGDKKEYAEAIKGFLKVPGEYRLVSLVAIGYPKGEPPQKGRRPLEEVLHWERFGCKC